METEEEFERSYLDQLEALGAEAILECLQRIGAGRPCALLCWERDPTDPETPCHRRYLAEFLHREAGPGRARAPARRPAPARGYTRTEALLAPVRSPLAGKC